MNPAPEHIKIFYLRIYMQTSKKSGQVVVKFREERNAVRRETLK